MPLALVKKKTPQLLKSLATYGFARGIAGALFFLTTFVYVRVLGDQGYGEITVSVAIAQLFSVLGYGWLAISATQLLPGVSPPLLAHRITIIKWAIFAVSVLTLIILSCIFATGLIIMDFELALPTLILAASYGASDVGLATANGLSKAGQYALVSVLRYGLSLVAGFVAIFFFHLGPAGALWGLVAGTLLPWLFPSAREYWRTKEKLRPTMEMLGPFLKMGLPSILILSSFVLITAVDRMVLGFVAGKTSAGVFGGVTDLVAGPISLIFQVISLAFAPIMYGSANAGDMAGLRRSTGTLMSVLLVIALPSAAFFLMLGSELSDFLIGQALSNEARAIFGLNALLVLASLIFNSGAAVMVSIGKIRFMLILSLVLILTNGVAIFLTAHSALAASTVSLFVMAIGTVVTLIASKITIGYKLDQMALFGALFSASSIIAGLQLMNWIYADCPLIVKLFLVGSCCLLIFWFGDVLSVREQVRLRWAALRKFG